jgi:hypothetical protein
MVSYSTTCVSSVTPIFSVLVSRVHKPSPIPASFLPRFPSPYSQGAIQDYRLPQLRVAPTASCPPPPPLPLRGLTTLLLELVLARNHVRETQRVLVRLELGDFVEIEPPRMGQTRSGEVFCERGSVRVGHVP